MTLPDWVRGFSLLGPVTREALLAGLDDGMRLATIVICVGAANSLANPKRLLRSVPPALYEIGTALVVAVTVLPQFVESVRRVRAAQALRAGETGRVRRLRRFLVPVLEDALERSLALAAGMDTRGYGRSGGASRAQRQGHRRADARRAGRRVRRCLRALDNTVPRLLALPMLLRVCGVGRGGLWPTPAVGSSAPLPPRPLAGAGVRGDAVGLAIAVVGLVGQPDTNCRSPIPTSPTRPEVSLVALFGSVAGLRTAAVAARARGGRGMNL